MNLIISNPLGLKCILSSFSHSLSFSCFFFQLPPHLFNNLFLQREQINLRRCRFSCLFRFRRRCFWLYFLPWPVLRRNLEALCICQVWLLACRNRKLLILKHELRWLCLDLFQILRFIISHFCVLGLLLTHWKDCILNWSGAEIIFNLFPSKIIFTKFWLPQLFTFKLSDYLIPLHFQLS